MPPVEQNSIPAAAAKHETADVKSIGEWKSVGKARELPVVSDMETYAVGLVGHASETIGSKISENEHVEAAKQIVEGGLKTLSEQSESLQQVQGKMVEQVQQIQGKMVEQVQQIQGKLIEQVLENPHVKSTVDTVMNTVHGAVENTKVKQAVATGYEMASSAVDTVKDQVKVAAEHPKVKQTVDVAQSSLNGVVENVKVKAATGYEIASSAVDTVKDQVKVAAEHPKVKQTVDVAQSSLNGAVENVKGKVASTVEQIDTIAAGAIDNLTTRMPALKEPTPELLETSKDAAINYINLAAEYVASYGMAQVGLKIADKSLSIAEKTTEFLHSDVKDGSMIAFAYNKMRQTRRALRTVRRAGERKSHLEKDPLAHSGFLGYISSMLSVNTILSLAGLQLVAEEKSAPVFSDEEKSAPIVNDKEDSSSINETEFLDIIEDKQHRDISDLKGDLEGYKSDEDSDYVPDAEGTESDECEYVDSCEEPESI